MSKSNLFKDLIRETLRGKTLPRILTNNRMRETKKVEGSILDLASGNQRPSYYRFLKISKEAKITSVDISNERRPDILADLEKPFPFKDAEFDNIFCFNMLEHVFNYRNVINESARVIKDDGRMIGTVPFLGSVHGDPDDYFRYTKSTLKRVFKKAGFRGIKIEAIGWGPMSVGYYLSEPFIPKYFKMFFLLPAFILDKIIYKLNKNHGRNKYVLMYYFECTK